MAVIRTAANSTACARSVSLGATAGPPVDEHRDDDDDHRDDSERAPEGHEIEQKRRLERGRRARPGQLRERVYVAVVARHEHGALRDDGGAEDAFWRVWVVAASLGCLGCVLRIQPTGPGEPAQICR